MLTPPPGLASLWEILDPSLNYSGESPFTAEIKATELNFEQIYSKFQLFTKY